MKPNRLDSLEIIYSSYKQLHILGQNLYTYLTEINVYFQNSLVHNPIGSHYLNKNKLKWSSNQLFCLHKHQCVSTYVYASLMICHVQGRTATLKDRNVGITIYIRTYKSEVHIFSFGLTTSILYKAKQKLRMQCDSNSGHRILLIFIKSDTC